MMAMNSKRKPLIIQTLMSYVAKNGIYDVQTKAIAKEAGVAEGLIFYYFKTKSNFIDEAAATYDRQLMARCSKLAEEGKNISEVWDILFAELLKEPDGAVFYFDYVNFYGFNPTENNKRAAEYLKAARTIMKEKYYMNDHEILILWDYVSTQLFYYVNKVVKHEMDATEADLAYLKKIAFFGYDGA